MKFNQHLGDHRFTTLDSKAVNQNVFCSSFSLLPFLKKVYSKLKPFKSRGMKLVLIVSMVKLEAFEPLGSITQNQSSMRAETMHSWQATHSCNLPTYQGSMHF